MTLSSPDRDALRKYFSKLTRDELIDKCVGLALNAHNVSKSADDRIKGQNAILLQLSNECERVHGLLEKYRQHPDTLPVMLDNPVIYSVGMMTSAEVAQAAAKKKAAKTILPGSKPRRKK